MEERISFQLETTDMGLVLTDGSIRICADFTKMLKRLRPDRLGRELLVRAAKGKRPYDPQHRTAVDATAGLGEDSLLLAAAGWEVTLFEKDSVIAALLRDGLNVQGGIPFCRISFPGCILWRATVLRPCRPLRLHRI